MWLRKPAYTSAIRQKSFLSSSESESHGRTTSIGFQGLPSTLVSSVYGFSGVSSASSGKIPISFWRSKTSSRYASYPMSNLPLYFSIHSAGAWCGAWVAPGQKYMKKGLSGAITFASLMNSIALSVRSVVRW